MIPATALAYLQALEDAMPLKPRVRVKAKGIPIGSYDEIKDAAGKIKLKRRPKNLSPPAEYARKKRRKYSRAAK